MCIDFEGEMCGEVWRVVGLWILKRDFFIVGNLIGMVCVVNVGKFDGVVCFCVFLVCYFRIIWCEMSYVELNWID